MPTYVYRRQDGTTFEVFQRISDDPLEVDPDTGEPVQRVIGGGAGLIFKGTGFYQTDYVRKSGGSETSPKSEGAESKADSKSESKTESKASNGDTSTSSKASKKTSSSDN